MGQNAALGQGQAKTSNANSNASYGVAHGVDQSEIGQDTPGSLSPAAAAQFAADRDNISNTYNNLRKTAFSTMGERGLGSAPSGFGQVQQNAIDQGQANAGTSAYRNAQVQTENQRQSAANREAALTGTEGNLGVANLGQSTNAAVAQNKAGSTLGDVVGAIGELAPIAAAPFTGGASLLPQLANGAAGGSIWKSLGKTASSVGSYGGGGGGTGWGA